MINFFSTYETYLKIAVILLYTGFIWYCHGIYDNAKLTKIAQHAEIKAEQGQNKIIEFHQQIKKIYVKVNEPCLDKPLPSDIVKLLK